MNIPIYDRFGEKISTLYINDEIRYVNGRVSKGKNFYYKGVGMPYSGHILPPLEPQTNLYGYSIIESPGVFYMGPMVKKQCFQNKYGIFQEKYQPQFSDFIGSCGAKELSLIENSALFEKTSVIVDDVVNYDEANQQYYFVLTYLCDRIKYTESADNPSERLFELLEYMVKSDWNFIWDKNSIEDISAPGLVTDVGDIFSSKELSAKLGTVYSVLFSLASASPKMYGEFCKFANLENGNRQSYVRNAIVILDRFGVDTTPLQVGDATETYKHAVRNYLITGKNCGDCCYVELGDKIREQYIRQTEAQWL